MADSINQVIKENENKPIHPMLMVWEILRKLWAVILIAVITASCTYVASSIAYVPQYQTNTTFVVSVRDGASSVYSNLSAAKSLAGSFSQILNSDLMRKYVARDLGVEAIDGEICASAIDETNLLEMQVVAKSPREAYLITESALANYEGLTETILNNITLDILQAPTVPTSPINYSNANRYAKMAALVSSALAVVWLCIRVYLRDTVKSVEEVEEKLDTKLLATVYHENKYKSIKELFERAKKTILITNPTTGFAFTETFKKLRTRVDYHMRKEGIKTIMVTSVHENEGKSTVAANLALAMRHRKKSVILIDGDMKKPAIHKILGYKEKNLDYKSVTEFLTGNATMSQTLIADKTYQIGLILGKKGSEESTEYISSSNMRKLVEKLAENVDVVIIDTPPIAVSPDAECLAEIADATLLVVRQDHTPARVINDAIDTLNETKAKVIGCVFNNVRAADLSDNYRYGSIGKYGYGQYGYGKAGYSKYGYGRRRGQQSKNGSEDNGK